MQIRKRYTFSVDASGGTYSKKFDLDKNIREVKGIMLSSDKPNLLYYRGSQKIELNGEELFPDEYESKLLMTGIEVSPNERFTDLGEGVLSGNGELKISFKDTNNTLAAFAAYQVSIYLLCELN